MAAIGHKFVQQATRQTEVSTSFVTQVTLSNADITNTADYLVFCHAHVGGDNENRIFQFQLAQAGTAIGDSLVAWEPVIATTTTQGFLPYDFFTVLRNIDGTKDIQFQMRTVDAGFTAIADGIVLGIIRLDADLTEDTGSQGDWVFNENTTTTVLDTTWKSFATDIVTSAAEDWLVMANVRVDIENTLVSFRARMNRDDVDLTPDFFQEGEDAAAEIRNYMMARVYTLTVGAHTFTLQAGDDGDPTAGRGAQPFNQHVRSAIFALRMDAFDVTASAFDDDLELALPDSLASPGAEVFSASVTPAPASDFLMVGWGKSRFLFQHDAFFFREGAATYLPTDDNLITVQSEYDQSDSQPVTAIAVPDTTIMTNAAHTITLRTYSPGASGNKIFQASMALISMELATAIGPIVLTPDALAVPVSLPTPTLSFGTKTLTPDALAVPVSLPEPTVSLGTKTLTPDALPVPISLPNPTVSLALTLTPDALAVPIVLPNITVAVGGVLTLLPDPVVVTIAIPDPTVAFATLTLTPDALAVPIVLPTPTVVLVKTLTPDALAVPIVLPTPTAALGDLTLTPDPVVVTILLSDVVVEAGVNYVFSGEDITEIDVSKYRSGVLFRYAAVLAAGALGQSGRSRFFNITDSVAVSGSEVTYTSATTDLPTLFLSSTFSLSGTKQYRPQHKADNPTETCVWHASKLGVVS